MIAAANPDTAAFGWAYVASAVGFVVGVALFCAIGVWLLDRLAARVYRRSIERARRALDRGDEQILRAVQEHEDAHTRRRHTVPKQLTADRSQR